MSDEPEYQQEEPLNFGRSHLRRCPYCGETLGSEELENCMAPESNTFICPNCRKKLNVHELGSGI